MKQAALALVWILAVMAAGISCAQSIEPIVDVSRLGELNLRAIDSAGNLLATYPSSPSGTWALIGNIPTMAGRPTAAPFVAISERYRPTTLSPDPYFHCVLTANGDVYAESGGAVWSFTANIAEAASHTPAGSFVAICTGAGLNALTDRGERYRSNGDLVTWEYIDSIGDTAGVVSTATSSIGSVKSAFR